MRRLAVLGLVLLALTLAGCMGSMAPSSSGAERQASNNSTAPASPTSLDPGWPNVSEATIRPGVTFGERGCTSGFLFRSADNSTLYLSAAGHCFEGKEVGDPVPIHEGQYEGEIAFSVFGGTSTVGKDFALVALDNSYRDEVHPAILRYGGPTGIAANVSQGDKVVTFGNSSYREPIDSVTNKSSPAPSAGNLLDPRGGIVRTHNKWSTYAYFSAPSIYGDSGSPTLTTGGEAIGTLSSISVGTSCGACNQIANLPPNLALSREAGMNVSLVTWPMINDDWPVATPDPLPAEDGSIEPGR
jgi:hypothetical protein